MPAATAAALYLRSSKDRADVSIDAQRRALHELAIARGLAVVDEYADAVESGKDDERPAFRRLLHALGQPGRAWSTVLVLDTSRVARRRDVARFFEREAKRHRVAVVYRTVPDTDPVTEMLLTAILQAMDEWHSLVSRQKGLAGMAENVRQGWRAGGRAPRGYRLEQVATGAVRDGAPVTKSRLVLDDAIAPTVATYLRLRAAGVARSQAIARSGLPWDTASAHSLDWQALTYAGHTVWNMHAESGAADKRRPRAQWIVQRGTHAALISDAEAEQILAELERATQGRRARASPLLLSGLVQAPDGAPWWSDGCGFYRAEKGKGRKVAAQRLEAAVLDQLGRDLLTDEAVERVLRALRALEAPEVDGRELQGMQRRAATLASQIARTVDLAAQLDDPAPVLRRVADLEHARAELLQQLEQRHADRERAAAGARITADDVRALLRRLFSEIAGAAADDELRAQARQALAEVVERIELDPATLRYRVHYAVAADAATGVSVASPRRSQLTPAVVRWQVAGEVPPLRRAA